MPFALIQASLLVLLATVVTAQECNYQQRVCECDPGQTECYFTLAVDKLASFTSYKLTGAAFGTFTDAVNAPSSSYIFNSAGILQPRDNATEDPSICSVYNEDFAHNNCSIPVTTDSSANAVIKTINGLIPGPTLVVNYNQTVVVDVINNLINEGLGVHWHGIHQNSTPWMDGVEHITQCPIPAFTTFRYIFKALNYGTLWYHSHTGTQRIDGVYGSLVVREPDYLMKRAKTKLQNMIGEEFEILDEPQRTLNLLDWAMLSVDVTLDAFHGVETPPPFTSGLINGIGRHLDIPYARSRLSTVNVEYRKESHPIYYRFRLIGAQNYYMYRFSIADHKLIVIATDGQLTEPIEVDYISIHSGERYDFLLKPKTEAEANGRTDFYILAETVLEKIQQIPRNIAEGILHYGTDADQPSSTEYEEIIKNTVTRSCTQDSPCTNLNCPFLAYPPGEFIRCIPVTQMQLLFETEDEVPSNVFEDEDEYIFDFSVFQPLGRAAVNGRFFTPPSGSLLTQPDDNMDFCQLGHISCGGYPDPCICLHMISLDSLFATTQLVLTSIGDGGTKEHPVHLHGHSFQVVGVFFGTYDSDGYLIGINPNVTCNGDPKCTDPTWTSSRVNGGEVTSKTVRKDTVTVPAGGYVVIRFIADNPGYWFMHCHMELHLIEGMNVVINELNNHHNPPPKQLAMQQCGSVSISVDQFNEHVTGR